MDQIQIKEKITMNLLIDEYIKKEKTNKATTIKKELINDLINKEIKYIDVISYYYEIKKENNE